MSKLDREKLKNSNYKNQLLAKVLTILEINAAELAKRLDVNAGIVSAWLSNSSPIPLREAARIEKLVNGKVKAKDLNPEAYKEFMLIRKHLG